MLRLSVLCLCLALASAVAPDAPLPCEAFGPSTCPRDCTLCQKRFGPKAPALCFSGEVAATLPEAVFNCHPKPKASADVSNLAKPAPEFICEAYSAAQCGKHPGCSLCTNTLSGKQLCFRQHAASKLPEGIFKCEPKPKADGAAYLTVDPAKPKPEVCEALSAAECKGHTKCSLCKKKFGPATPDLCFDQAIAAKLPPFIFECDPKPKAPEEEEAANKPVPTVCEMLSPTECAATPECSLCENVFSGVRLCFRQHVAAKLPEGIFTCKPKPDPKQLTLAADKPIPEICEMYDEAECGKHPKCVVCKQKFVGTALCFDSKIAAKLPPFIFSCAAPAEEPANKPIPEICEMYNPTECAAHKDTCSLCKNVFVGKELCFNPKVAAGLPPQVFKCKGPAPEPAPEPADLAAATLDKKAFKGVCEMYGAEECLHHDCARCTLKFGPHPKSLCFRPSVAEGLSKVAFSCEMPKKEEEEAVADPNHDACYRLDEAQCSTAIGCVWCLGAKAPSGCYFAEKAQRLPKAQFQCRFPAMLTSSRKARL